jgi:hypothetical protein
MVIVVWGTGNTGPAYIPVGDSITLQAQSSDPSAPLNPACLT